MKTFSNSNNEPQTISSLPHLRALRAEAAERRIRVFTQGGQWIQSQWSERRGAWSEGPMGYALNGQPERVALAVALSLA